MERTVTFTMEDALISPEGFMILSGAGLIDASADKPVYQHMTEIVNKADTELIEDGGAGETSLKIKLTNKPYLPVDQGDNFAYVMLMKSGEIVSEPYIPEHGAQLEQDTESGTYTIVVKNLSTIYTDMYTLTEESAEDHSYSLRNTSANNAGSVFPDFDSIMVDYYVERTGNAQQIEITADKFGGNYYLEASTLFRDTKGVDMPAEFIIPNCKIQSNFTFTMASSGDPSSFTFTMDAFPDYTKFDKSKKVLAAIQIIKKAASQEIHRHSTHHETAHDLFL